MEKNFVSERSFLNSKEEKLFLAEEEKKEVNSLITMYRVTDESGIGPKKYGAIASDEDKETKYIGHDDDEPVYQNSINYNSSDEEDPLKAGYNAGAPDDEKKDKEEKDELWDIVSREEGKKEDAGEEGNLVAQGH